MVVWQGGGDRGGRTRAGGKGRKRTLISVLTHREVGAMKPVENITMFAVMDGGIMREKENVGEALKGEKVMKVVREV